MKERLTFFLLFLTLILSRPVFAQEAMFPEIADFQFPIMRPDPITLQKWMDDYETAPRSEIDPVIHSHLLQAQATAMPTSLSLLNHIQYTPSQRNQGSCGDCWAWASTGVMEIALSVQGGVLDRLSTQFINSCYPSNETTGDGTCCGGNLYGFSSWYGSKGYAIPWSNTNAFYQDGSNYTLCGSFVPCGNISTTPRYPITSISPTTVSTTGSADAVTNIKTVLNSGKGVYFAYFLANNADWNGFHSFWSNQTETVLWDPDVYCGSGHAWNPNEGGGHAVLIVGYDDSSSDSAQHYWIVLNSWATAGGRRPNGLFRMKMHMNYNCTMPGFSGNPRQFQTLNMAFNVAPPPSPPAIQLVSPDGGEYWTAGSTHPITWTSSNLNPAGGIYISYWYNNAWRPIAGPLSTSTTSYLWTVSDMLTSSALISVGNWVNGAWEVEDQSTQEFIIIGNSIYVAQNNYCGGNDPCRPNIQEGIALASVPSVVNISKETYDDVTLESGQVIILQGGWNTKFTSNSSFTTINGSITITNGTMILENILLR